MNTKNLPTYSNPNDFDFAIQYNNDYFAFDTDFDINSNTLFMSSQLVGNKKSSISLINDKIMICSGQMHTKNTPISILQNRIQNESHISLCFLLDGNLNFGIDTNKKSVFKKGHSFIDCLNHVRSINNLSLHSNISTVDFHFEEKLFKKYYSQLKESGVISINYEAFSFTKENQKLLNIPITPKIYNILQEIVNCSFYGAAKELYQEAKVTELLIIFFNHIEMNLYNKQKAINMLNSDREKLYFLKEYIEKNSFKPKKLDELAQMIGMSITDMQIKFKKLFGTTIIQFDRKTNMHKAHELIRNGHYVKDVSYLAGYSTIAAFSKAFYKEFGYRPSSLYKQ